MSYHLTTKPDIDKLKCASYGFGPRRAVVVDIEDVLKEVEINIKDSEILQWEYYDLIYRTLCGIMYNFVPMSGHPGGSISSGRIVSSLIYNTIDYDFSNPNSKEADMVSYAAGHKALGLYTMWALRNEIMRIAHPEMLPSENLQLRFEDLLGFRRNPTNNTPLFKKFNSKPLDGHPTPATPFIKIATGASGVGVGASFGLALGALDTYLNDPPKVHVIEGEGGMTPGRVYEALTAAASAQLWNIIMHVDWNQSSIDSNKVCRDGQTPGDYVQWNPIELAYLNDWNAIIVKDGMNFKNILAAQNLALQLNNKQPTMIVYRTVKGWKYGIEGRKSHGAGHKFCSDNYCVFLDSFEETFKEEFPEFKGDMNPENIESCFYESLMIIRKVMEREKEMVKLLADGIMESKKRLETRARKPRENSPQLNKLYNNSEINSHKIPESLNLASGTKVTLRGSLGNVINHINKITNGAFFGSAADLLDSTSVSNVGKGFSEGLYNSVSNNGSRLIAIGGICEDAMGAFMAGLASYGKHIGVTSSYGAFIAALEHIASRLHGIGQQTKKACINEPYNTFIMINAHAGLKTGEDGPTHADPQALQLLQENFPKSIMITLTPWDPAEMWPLVVESLLKRPAVLAPFVTRPEEVILDRKTYKLPDLTACTTGIYSFRKADMTSKQYNGTVILQGSGVAYEFIRDVLPKLDEQGINMNVYYVSSAELFDLLPEEKQNEIYPAERANEAICITDFTMPTMYRFVTSQQGRKNSLYPFKSGHYLGSGQAHKVLEEAHLNGKAQYESVISYAREFEKKYSSEKKH